VASQAKRLAIFRSSGCCLSAMASQDLERDLVKESTGFQSKEEYKRKREQLEHEKALQALKRMANGTTGGAAASSAAADADGDAAAAAAADGGGSGKKKKKKKTLSALSFGDALEAEGEASPSVDVKKMGKCQDANVSFLEKNAAEKEAAAVKQEAALRELLQQQAKAREEVLTLKYTFRSERTQREVTTGVLEGEVRVKRGATADEAAIAVRSDVEARNGPKFAPTVVGGVSTSNEVLLCVCAAGMPQGTFALFSGAVSLVELSTRRWADSQEPLVDDFAHGLVVTERRYYEQWKHLYPFSHWRPYESRDEYQWSEYVRTRGQPYKRLEPNRQLGQAQKKAK